MPGPSLHQTLSQNQALAPQMRQSLEILQANTLELQQLLQQSLDINPVLEHELTSVSLDEMEQEQPDSEGCSTPCRQPRTSCLPISPRRREHGPERVVLSVGEAFRPCGQELSTTGAWVAQTRLRHDCGCTYSKPARQHGGVASARPPPLSCQKHV